MTSNAIYLMDRGISSRFLANIAIDYPHQYKLISSFFGFTFTKNSYNCFFKESRKLRGFNNSINIFLCPWEEQSIKYSIKSLKAIEDKIRIDALIVNGRLLNIYTDINLHYLYNILDNSKLSLIKFENYINLFLSSFLNYHIKILFFQLNILIIFKK
jgi:hypothetical protein